MLYTLIIIVISVIQTCYGAALPKAGKLVNNVVQCI